MSDKPWYKSKGKLGGLLVAAAGVLQALGLVLQGQLDAGTALNQIIPLIGIGLGIIGVRDAQK